ncbi:MAG: hypothetical protein PVJ76_13645 [Gemmatimonadota bacterium]|jgi:uncharacterized protein YjbJ (UPF0337 family)
MVLYKRMKTQAEAIEEVSEHLKKETEETWEKVKTRLRKIWAPLDEDELDRCEGQLDLLLGVIQEKTGQSREDVARELEAIAEEEGYDLK